MTTTGLPTVSAIWGPLQIQDRSRQNAFVMGCATRPILIVATGIGFATRPLSSILSYCTPVRCHAMSATAGFLLPCVLMRSCVFLDFAIDIENSVTEEHIRLGSGRSSRRISQLGVLAGAVLCYCCGSDTAADVRRGDCQRPRHAAVRRNRRPNI